MPIVSFIDNAAENGDLRACETVLGFADCPKSGLVQPNRHVVISASATSYDTFVLAHCAIVSTFSGVDVDSSTVPGVAGFRTAPISS